MKGNSRGQAYALEGVIGVLIIGMALVLGMQIVDVTSSSDDGGDLTEIESQASDILHIAREDDLLRKVATCVDGDGEPATLEPGEPPNSAFETLLAETLENRETYTIEIEYRYANGTVENESLLFRSAPARAAATVTEQITLFDEDPVRSGPACNATRTSLEDANDDEFYIDNRHEDSEVYAMVKLRVIVW